jgi:hypothetical protein
MGMRRGYAIALIIGCSFLLVVSLVAVIFGDRPRLLGSVVSSCLLIALGVRSLRKDKWAE